MKFELGQDRGWHKARETQLQTLFSLKLLLTQIKRKPLSIEAISQNEEMFKFCVITSFQQFPVLAHKVVSSSGALRKA